MSAESRVGRSATSRRAMLQQLAAALGAAALPWRAARAAGSPVELRPVTGSVFVQAAVPRRGLVLGPGRFAGRNGTPVNTFSVLDLDSETPVVHTTHLDFYGHGMAPHPEHPERITVFEKQGKGACEVDIAAGEVLRPIQTRKEQAFYGHGAFSKDARLLYAAETVISGEFKGLIAVRDAKSHEYLGEFPTHGSFPHDCTLIDDGKVMVITNGGGPVDGPGPSVTYVEVASGKLLQELPIGNPRFNAGHLAVSANGDLVAISAPRMGLDKQPGATGGISHRRGGSAMFKLRSLSEPVALMGRLVGETLSVCIDDRRRVFATTTPAANLLAFWNLDSGELIKAHGIPAARGVTLTRDRASYVVSCGMPTEQMVLLDVESLEPRPQQHLARTLMTGSHIISHSLR